MRARWRADPDAAFAADVGGTLAGSNVAAHWGSVGFFGPLTVHPALWDRGVGKRLYEAFLEKGRMLGATRAKAITAVGTASLENQRPSAVRTPITVE